MTKATTQGVSNVLLFGFGLIGPNRIASGTTMIEGNLSSNPTLPLQGTLTAQSTIEIEMGSNVTLALLRGLLALGVAAHDTQASLISAGYVSSNLLRNARKFLRNAFGSALNEPAMWTFDTNGSPRGEGSFFGLGESLDISLELLSELGVRSAFDGSEAAQLVSSKLKAALAGYPQEQVFKQYLSSEFFTGRQRPEFSRCLNGPLLRYFASDDYWRFWEEWFRSFIDDTPLDWELQRRVALIPDEDWEQGPEHIAKCIEKIRAKFALEQEISALKKRLSKAVVAPVDADRLHNQPPEPVEDVEVRIRGDVVLVWDQLVELEDEIAKPEPSPSRLKKIAETLMGLAKKVTAYCAELGDITAKKAAEEIGTTGTKYAIRATVAYFTVENEGVQAVVKAIWEYAKTLPPG